MRLPLLGLGLNFKKVNQTITEQPIRGQVCCVRSQALWRLLRVSWQPSSSASLILWLSVTGDWSDLRPPPRPAPKYCKIGVVAALTAFHIRGTGVRVPACALVECSACQHFLNLSASVSSLVSEGNAFLTGCTSGVSEEMHLGQSAKYLMLSEVAGT